MGYSKKRIDGNGKPRYTACYLDVRGSLRSAGTFSSKKDADKAWQTAETRLGEGRVNDPRRGRQTFRRYVTEEWLAHHVIEASTREAYTYQISKHILNRSSLDRPVRGELQPKIATPADATYFGGHLWSPVRGAGGCWLCGGRVKLALAMVPLEPVCRLRSSAIWRTTHSPWPC